MRKNVEFALRLAVRNATLCEKLSSWSKATTPKMLAASHRLLNISSVELGPEDETELLQFLHDYAETSDNGKSKLLKVNGRKITNADVMYVVSHTVGSYLANVKRTGAERATRGTTPPPPPPPWHGPAFRRDRVINII